MYKRGIVNRAARVSAVSGLSTLVSIGFQIISVPICLTYWGKDTYGGWLALYSASMMLKSIDSGYVTYMGNKLTYLYYIDQREMHRRLASAVSAVTVIGLAQLLLATAALLFDDASAWLGVEPSATSSFDERLGLTILLGTWALYGPYQGIVHRLMPPAGLMYQGAWWSMAFQVAQFLAIIAAAILKLTLLQTSILFSAVQASIYFICAIYIRSKLPVFYPWWRGGSRKTGISDLLRSTWLTVTGVIQQGINSGIVVLIATMSGSAGVPLFTTVRTLTNLWATGANVLTAPLFPDLIRFHAAGDREKLISVLKVHWVLVVAAVNLSILVIHPFVEPLYNYWTAGKILLDRALLAGLLGAVAVANVSGLISLYLNGVNSARILLIVAVSRGVTIAICGVMLYPHLGVGAFAAAILLAELLATSIQWRFFSVNYLPKGGARTTRRASLLVALGTATLLLYLLAEMMRPIESKSLYFVAVLGNGVATVFGWRGLDADIRLKLTNSIKNLNEEQQ
jgi:O-antigen/teichoic acid export membrane protein